MFLRRLLSPSEEGWEFDKEDDFVLMSIWRLWRIRISRLKNKLLNAVFPIPLDLLWITMALVLGLHVANVSLPLVNVFPTESQWVPCMLLAMVSWAAVVVCVRGSLKLLLTYKGWLKEERGRGSVSFLTKLWLVSLKLLTCFRKPLLYSFQGVLPRMPLPSVDHTIQRYLQSMRPLLADNQYAQVEKLAEEFKAGVAPKLQRQLILKSWLSNNYVTDWWEEYAYLRSRSPLIVNSNFYALDCLTAGTTNQAARAATFIHASLLFRRRIERQEVEPIMVQRLIPLCMMQLERLFNTTRVPGEEVDRIVHYTFSKHIVVYHKGRYFRVPIYHKGRLLLPREIEIQMEHILQETSSPAEGEERLAALTAGDRSSWAKARSEFFSRGVNKASLDTIERAAFFVALDDFPYKYHESQDDPDKLEAYGRALFHGKGFDRWFDKSFSLCFGTDGKLGVNGEHSWADGAIMALYFEYAMLDEAFQLGYTPEGHSRGILEGNPPLPTRLSWDLPPQALATIERSCQVAQSLIEDVDLKIHIYRKYGKGFVKTCKVSPDAYLQMALQLAYFRDVGKFGLTYESGTSRLFLEGRTETVRPCTQQSSAWVLAMQSNSATADDKVQLLRKACLQHQRGFLDVMCGKGIDRHLFSLYLVSRHLQEDSPFLREVVSEPWLLSTSQTPNSQTGRADLKKYPGLICGGGGFGPTADDGYGVSYIITGEDRLFFHVTCKRSSRVTDSSRFLNQILKALAEMKSLFEEWNDLQKK